MSFSWGWKWLAVVSAGIAFSMLVFWPNQNRVMRYDEAWLLPNSGQKGEKVNFYLKGYWFEIPLRAELAETIKCEGIPIAVTTIYQVDLSKAKVGYLDKLASNQPRPFTLPDCPGKFTVTGTLTAWRATWWGYVYKTVQPGPPEFSGRVLP